MDVLPMANSAEVIDETFGVLPPQTFKRDVLRPDGRDRLTRGVAWR